MKRISLLLTVLTLVLLVGCSASNYGTAETGKQTTATNGEAEILQSWQGDFPVNQLQLLPEKQRQQAVGFIDDAETFGGVWRAFKPGEDVGA